jgi:DNA polymerase-1
MSAKWQHRDEGKKVSKSVVRSKSLDELKVAAKFITSLLDLRKAEKLQKTYIHGTKKAIDYNEGHKLYVDYRLDGTATGRLSCAAYNAEKPMGVSFHTLPRETNKANIRSMFVAPKGKAFVTVDYAAMELRVLAHIAKEKSMQHAFNSGADLHTYTGKLLFSKDEITKEERQIAKTVSFLIVYGGGAFNLSETMGIPLNRAEEIIKNYQRVYPGIFRYMEFINNFIKENSYAYTIFGRRRNLPDVNSRDRSVINRALRQGLNFTIQSSASDILLCGLLGVSNRFKEKSLDAQVVATVHDSLEIISSEKDLPDCLEIVYDELVNYPNLRRLFGINFDVPLSVDLEVGRSFGDGIDVGFTEGKPTNLDEIYTYLNNN